MNQARRGKKGDPDLAVHGKVKVPHVIILTDNKFLQCIFMARCGVINPRIP